MNLDPTVLSVLAATVPTAVIGVMGFLARTAIGDVREALKSLVVDLRELKEASADDRTKLEVALTRISHLETERLTKMELEIGSLRAAIEALRAEIAGLRVVPGRARR